MTSISHSQRYLPHELTTKYYATKLYRSGYSVSFVCRRYKISKSSLMRWNRKFDGPKESLVDKSHRPISKHPNAHTDTEIKWIKNLIRRNPHISMSELYGKLRTEYGYSRHAASLFRLLRKIGFYVDKEKHTKYVPKTYDTPTNIGIKWQLDVKYVPKECYSGKDKEKFYQYTVLMKLHVKDLFIHTKNNLLTQLLILLKELLFILVINQKLYKLIMVLNLLIQRILKEFILLIHCAMN